MQQKEFTHFYCWGKAKYSDYIAKLVQITQNAKHTPHISPCCTQIEKDYYII